jgi:hypothetical protein
MLVHAPRESGCRAGTDVRLDRVPDQCGPVAEDDGFPAEILGDDRLPPELLERVREQVRRAGGNPALVQR